MARAVEGATPPSLIHADWSKHPAKRWMAHARWHDDHYVVGAAQPALSLSVALGAQREADRAVLLGVDAPLGVPRAWAERAGVASFRALLQAWHEPKWASFARPAVRADEIALTRPFYPARPGGARLDALVSALGLPERASLRRRCELPRPGRSTPCPIFWTMGANQVGKGALALWSEVLVPHRDAPWLKLWPMDGALEALLQPGHVVICETYPAWIARALACHVGPGGKRAHEARLALEGALLSACERLNVRPSAEALAQLTGGFGEDVYGEDRLDAWIGALGLVSGLPSALASKMQPEDAHLEGTIWSGVR